jgi:dihydrofolate reductase
LAGREKGWFKLVRVIAREAANLIVLNREMYKSLQHLSKSLPYFFETPNHVLTHKKPYETCGAKFNYLVKKAKRMQL